MMWLLALVALAEDVHVVRAGDTVESVAAGLGTVRVARRIRSLNGLEPGEQPRPGDLLRLPDVGEVIRSGGLVLSVTGAGVLTAPGQPATPLTVGLPVEPGAVVCTDATSSATVRLAIDAATSHHDDVVLLPDTCLTLEAATVRGRNRASTVSMDRGTVSVRSATAPGSVHIRTPSGITSGDDGGFRVTIEPDAARTEAWYARVAVIGDGVQVDVPAEHGTRVHTGDAPEAPIALLPPGAPILPPTGDVLRRPSFTWTSVDRALGYRVELGSSDAFDALLYGEEVPTTAWDPEFLMIPYRVPGLWWRVSSVDRTGFVGVPSEARELRFPPTMGP